jgi:hypothetical protein
MVAGFFQNPQRHATRRRRIADMRRLNGWRREIRRLRATYAQMHGQMPNLFRPRGFTEKMQWRKLFDRNPAFNLFCDKLATRDFVARRIGAEYLVPLYWTGTAEEIPFDRLMPPYFLKSTHASAQVASVTAAGPDPETLQAEAAAWLQTCYFQQSGEPGYKDVPRRLLAEQTLLGNDGQPPEERRLFVFDGKVEVINTVFVEAGKLRNGAFHTRDWKRLDWYFTRFVSRDFPPPQRLADMIRIAEQLGAGIDHIRVDIFDCGERFFVGELTPYSWGGFAHFNPEAADLAFGKYWHLPWPRLRAVVAILFSAPPVRKE